MIQVPTLLPGWAESILREGKQGRYRSRQAAALALFSSMLNCGWGWREASDALCDRESRAMGNLLSSLSEARTLWLKAQEYISDNPAIIGQADAKVQLGEIKSELMTVRFTGRTATRDRMVLEAIHRIALKHNTVIPALAERVLAEETGMSKDTCGRALKALTQAGWLRLHRSSDGTRAHRFRVCTPNCAQMSQYLPQVEALRASGSSVHTFALDVSSTDVGRCLGRSASVLLAALDPVEAQQVKDLVHTSGLSRRTVHKWLLVLVAEGLAFKDAFASYVRVEADLEAVAEDMGVAGKSAAVRRQHVLEREMWEKIPARARRSGKKLQVATVATANRTRNRPSTAKPRTSRPVQHLLSIELDIHFTTVKKTKKTRRAGRRHRKPQQTPLAA